MVDNFEKKTLKIFPMDVNKKPFLSIGLLQSFKMVQGVKV